MSRHHDEHEVWLDPGFRVSSQTHDSFYKRLAGLSVPLPVEHKPLFPARVLFAIIGVFSVLKLSLLLTVGAAEYRAQVALFEQGTFVEKVGGLVLQVDPLTQQVYSLITQAP